MINLPEVKTVERIVTIVRTNRYFIDLDKSFFCDNFFRHFRWRCELLDAKAFTLASIMKIKCINNTIIQNYQNNNNANKVS